MPTPTLIVVSGPAGSGKTTLAHALADAIGCPAICRDEIKEGMVHAVGGGFEAAPDDPLTRRTFAVFFRVVRLLLEAGTTVVAEAAFQDHLWRPNLEPLTSLAGIRIVRCHADADTSRTRIASRPHRAAHADASVLRDADYFDAFVAVSMPVPTIDVDTSNGYEPPFDRIVRFAADSSA